MIKINCSKDASYRGGQDGVGIRYAGKKCDEKVNFISLKLYFIRIYLDLVYSKLYSSMQSIAG